MKIKIFGKLTDIFNSAEYELEIEKFNSVSALRSTLEEKVPNLKGMTYIIVVDGKKLEKEEIFLEPSEIALLPPYSGG